VHRIGRTGRAGRLGTAITIVAPIDGKSVDAIEKLTGQSIPWMEKPPAAVEDERPARAEAGNGRRRRGERSGRHEAPSRHEGGRPHRSERPTTAARGQTPQNRPPRDYEEADTSHLPAFLLRPVPLKADRA
jgi:superfamily II DNA/RNA helicase